MDETSLYEIARRLKADPNTVRDMSPEQFSSMVLETAERQAENRKLQQINFYHPVSSKANQIHLTNAKVIGVGGGNGSSKTETCIVELVACATGAFPTCLHDEFMKKFRGPINCRIVLESLTTVLHPIILPKLKWWVWTGVGEQGGSQGHWGWVPKAHLLHGVWDRSWSEKLRILTVKCIHPITGEYLGDSTIQFMSHDQDPSDFASGDFHIVMHDEPPMEAIWIENEARTMRVDGRMFLAMTWPDDPSVPVDWIFDRVHDVAGPEGSDIVWYELHTTDNAHLNQKAVASQMSRWSSTTRQVRIFGKPIRFSNLIHPDFTDVDRWWCFGCGKLTMVHGHDDGFAPSCMECSSVNVTEYCHVKDFDIGETWPVVWVLDPHPRKPHMFMWVAVDPQDDLWVVADGECEGETLQVRKDTSKLEQMMRLNVVQRIMDPNMGLTSPGVRRQVTWQDEFHAVDLACDLADDSDVGRSRLNDYFKPDKDTEQPRIHIHKRCTLTIFQLKRYVWGEHGRRTAGDKDVKQQPRPKYDDYPTMMKYLLNMEPNYRMLQMGAPIIGPRRASKKFRKVTSRKGQRR